MLRYFTSENAELVRRVWTNNADLVRCVCIDQAKAYTDISLRSWVAIRFITVQEVLAAHTMVIFHDEVGGYVAKCVP